VRAISTEVGSITSALDAELASEIAALERLTGRLAEQAQGARLTDLALNAIEIIDRNLYERTCDVRWWATDSAVVDCAADPQASCGESPLSKARMRSAVAWSTFWASA